MSNLVNIAFVAERLGVSTSRIRQMDPVLKPTRVGVMRVYDAEDIDNYIKARDLCPELDEAANALLSFARSTGLGPTLKTLRMSKDASVRILSDLIDAYRTIIPDTFAAVKVAHKRGVMP